MTELLSIAGNTIAYDVIGQGPLVFLAHGIGDSRHSYRFLAPALAVDDSFTWIIDFIDHGLRSATAVDGAHARSTSTATAQPTT